MHAWIVFFENTMNTEFFLTLAGTVRFGSLAQEL